MRHISTLITFLFLFSAYTYGQDKTYLGKSKEFLKELNRQLHDDQARRSDLSLSLRVNDSLELDAKVTYQDNNRKGAYLIGTIPDVTNGSFFIRSEDSASLYGHIIFREEEKAYRYSSDFSGNAYIQEEDINDILCINFDNPEILSEETEKEDQDSLLARAPAMLSSKPGANGVIYLDFNGEYVSGTLWNDGNPVDAEPSGMSDALIRETWEIISEDFRPFNVNVTTDEAVFNAAPQNRRIRCIFTPTDIVSPGGGGIAYVNSFSWNDDTPCWVFNTGGSYGAGIIGSHEIGHTMGLSHDGQGEDEYFSGHGNWGPIMGTAYSRGMVQWSIGEYENATNQEDDLARIARAANGLGFCTDDHDNSTQNASEILTTETGEVLTADNNGLIEQTTDTDFFRFTTSGGQVQLEVNPAERYENLNILATLYDNNGQVINTYSPAGNAATINTSLDAGDYYLSVEGTGEGDPFTNGYSDYGSVGIYSLSGTIPIISITQLPYNGTPWPVPGRVEMENYDEGGQGFSFNDLTESNDPGEYRNNDVDIQATGSGYSVTNIESGEWLEFTIDVQEAGYHRIVLQVSSASEQGEVIVESDRENVSGTINIPNTGGRYAPVESYFELQAGIQVMRIYINNGGFDIDYIDFPDVTIDCNGNENGTAYIDECNECVGGNTGLSPCEQDCEGNWDGTAFTDDCGTCVDGNTGLKPCNVTLEEGLYVIHPVHSDLCLTPGNDITQETCTDDSLQIWRVTRSGSYYEIYSVNEEQYLNYSFSGGQELYLSSDPGLIRLEDAGGIQFPTFHIVPSTNTDEVADVTGNNSSPGANIIFYQRTGGDNQRYTFIPYGTTDDCNGVFGGTAYIDDCNTCVGGTTGRNPCIDLPDNNYVIKPLHSGLCLENTDPVTQQNCSMQSNQTWTVTREGDYYRISSQLTNEYLGYQQASESSDIINVSETGNNLFRLEDAGNGTAYMIPEGNPDITVDISGNNLNPGGNLILWTNQGQDNQRFVFEEILITSTEKTSGESTGRIYPNPFEENVTMEFEGAFTFLVQDLRGGIIMKGSCNNSCKTLENLDSGFYILTIMSGNKVRKIKLEKQF